LLSGKLYPQPEYRLAGGEDFTQSVAYREIFGLGEAREAAKVTLRQLNRRGWTIPLQATH